jgi:hypothetical protein
MCHNAEVDINVICSTFLHKYETLLECLFSSKRQDGKDKTRVEMFSYLSENIPVTIKWENGKDSSGQISFLVCCESDVKALRRIFTLKNLYTSEKKVGSQYLLWCSLDNFLDWSRFAIGWNKKS